MSRPSKAIIFTASKPGFETLAYHDQWVKAWLDSPHLQTTLVDFSRSLSWREYREVYAADILVFLHSTNSNEFLIPRILRKTIRFTRAKKVFFVGNEYKFMGEKMELIDELGIDLICSQVPEKYAEWLYAPCRSARVICVPPGLDASRYRPRVPIAERPIDIGVRAFEYPWYLGDRDRAEITETFLRSPKLSSFRTDISMDPEARFTGDGWADFLNQCRATISTEAGASYLQRNDRLRNDVNAFLASNPHAPYAEVYDRFFRSGVPESVSGKVISSRHFEAIGTRTAQIMFPGEFNGILLPDVHYIALNRDYTNFDDVLARLEDTSYLEKMTANTLEYCLAEHRFETRIERVLRHLGA
jgi:hypothetical protein